MCRKKLVKLVAERSRSLAGSGFRKTECHRLPGMPLMADQREGLEVSSLIASGSSQE